MQEYKIYTLEDNNDYELVDEIVEEDITYLLLSQMNNISNIVVRRIIKDDVTGEEYLDRLSDDKFNYIFDKFIRKNKNLFD